MVSLCLGTCNLTSRSLSLPMKPSAPMRESGSKSTQYRPLKGRYDESQIRSMYRCHLEQSKLDISDPFDCLIGSSHHQVAASQSTDLSVHVIVVDHRHVTQRQSNRLIEVAGLGRVQRMVHSSLSKEVQVLRINDPQSIWQCSMYSPSKLCSSNTSFDHVQGRDGSISMSTTIVASSYECYSIVVLAPR